MIVDGGLGEELARRGFAFTTGLWSGEAILARPELLAAIHRDYLAAGAEVIETATYQLSHARLRAMGYDDAAVDAVFARAVRLAREAVGSCAASVVAGSLGPYGATIGDGSEYSGAQHLEPEALYAFHAERARSMARAAPDVILFETIPSRAEALVIARVARDLDLKDVWLSFSCADGMHTCGGDRLCDIAAELESFACIGVVGVNCTPPQAIASLVRALKTATVKPLMVCPNLGQHWDGQAHRLAGGTTEAQFKRGVAEWLDLGVTHVGGCCGVGPEMIGEIARLVAAARAGSHASPGLARRT